MVAISDYEIINKIYESDRSVVYRAWRHRDRQPIILKILKADRPTLEELIRYKQEYEITHSLNLAGAIEAYSLESFHNTLLITLEDFGGESLEILSKVKRMTVKDFLEIAILIGDSLGKIHTANIIHKDISPANIVFNPITKQLKIIDFGISTILSKETPNFSHPGILEGTLSYISPEQTGRMNRNVDYRTDFYSLGATFYHLLTHQLPFDTNDPLELIHCHLAKQPIPPHQLNSNIPLALSQIILKLLAKTAEERYQSAWGITADLKNCLQQLENNRTITEFELGKEDISDKLQIPQKLYGREREIEILLDAFERGVGRSQSLAHFPPLLRTGVRESGVGEKRAEGATTNYQLPTTNYQLPITNYQFKPELILVRGYAGIGKSSLVKEIFKLVTQKKGYFVQGKYEQYQRHIPYFGLIQALQELIQQLLLEDSDRLAKWRDRILAACGENIRVIIDVIPELSLLLERHSAIATLNPTAAQHRFKLVFQNLIQVFAQAEHPLTIFLDDLQWVDSASLQLIRVLVTEENRYLFLIGAYRDNEVNAFHPLSLSLEDLTKAGVAINYISLTPLNLSDVERLLFETFKCDREVTAPLAKLILDTTHGNPFFINECISTLQAENLLKFERERQVWHWDLTEIKLAQATHNNLTELLVKKIQKLDNDTQQVLQLAACIGSSFELSTLVSCMTKPAKVIAALLQTAIAASLIIPIGNDYKAIDLDISSLTKTLVVRYKFAHDRIQQAAYSLIPKNAQQTLHQKVGRTLLQNTPFDKQEEKIFDIVNQLNFSISLIQNQTEKDELAALNLIAAKKAKKSIAYESALNYASLGIQLIREKSWQRQYELSLALFLEAAEAAYLCGKFALMEMWREIVLQQAKNLLDKVKVYEIEILAHVAQGKPLAAVKTAIYVLRLLGVSLPRKPNKFKILLAAIATKFVLRDRQIETLIDLPHMSNSQTLAAMKIMGIAGSPTYNAAPQFAPLLAFAGVNLSLNYGNTAMSAYGYASYGVMLCGVLGNINAGYQFGKLALNLLEKFQAKELKARTFMVFNNFIRHWKEHVREGLSPLLEAYQSGLDTGDIEFAAYCAFVYCYHSYFVGKELTALAQEMDIYLQAIARLKQETALHLLQPYRQAVANLLGTTENPCFFSSDNYDENKMLSLLSAVNHKTALFHFYCQKIALNYLFEAYDRAADNVLQAEKYIDSVIASLSLPIFNFYHSLTLISTYKSASAWRKIHLLSLVKVNQRQMQKWADCAPMNYLHKYYLVEAEKNRILGNCIQAMDDYDRAIALAQKHAYLQEEALANELAAKFYLEIGKDTIARVHLLNARSGYLIWGATAKVKALDTKYAQLLFTPSARTVNLTESNDSSIHAARLFDLNTFIKAAQIISGEIVFQDLINKIMQTAIENAGAELGFLLLKRDKELVIEAVISVVSAEQTIHLPVPVTSDLLPISLINYVAERKIDVVLQNTIDSYNFARDPYIQLHKPKSVLCAPILSQNQLVGIFYLENNLVTGAFTSDRLKILRLLCSQAAISLKNAQLYQDLKRSELKEREKARQLEKSLQKLQIAQNHLVQVQEQLLHDAFHDPLTNLPNRALLIERLEQTIKMHKRHPDYLYALLFIDIDRFKVVNDSLGHLVGDELIKSVASRLKIALRASDTVARLGGDEFVILLENIRDLEEATAVAERIQAQLKQPYRLHEYEVFTTASIGITFSTMNYERASDVLRDADAAMYHAKEQHKGRYQIFAPAMQARASARLQLESDLRRAIAQQEFSLYYQPIVQLSNGCLTGFEALIRWYHPQQGWIAPTEFIPVAEETGSIDSLGWWVLHQACLQLQTWRERFPNHNTLAVNVNLSVQQLKQADAAERIEQILQTTQVPGECLKLEITESCLLETADLAPQLLERLQDLGVKLCIDDFGTGYSSLSRLHDLPIDTLKIDRSFVNHLESSRHTEIVQTIVTLARSLSINVVAEGIETQLQLEKLQQFGCDLGQGYLFSQPVESQKAEEWLMVNS